MQKLNSMCPKERFEVFFGKNNYISFTVSRPWAEKCALSAIVSSRFIKTAFNMYGGLLWGSFLRSLHDLHHFRTMSKKQIHFRWKVFGRIVKMLRVLRNILERNIFLKKLKLIFFDFHTLSEFLSNFWRKNSSMVVRIAVYVHEGTFWWFFFFFVISIFFSSLSYFIWRNLSKFFRNSLASFSKMQSGCPGDKFEGK